MKLNVQNKTPEKKGFFETRWGLLVLLFLVAVGIALANDNNLAALSTALQFLFDYLLIMFKSGVLIVENMLN